VAIVILSADESPVIVMPVPAVNVNVSASVSATGDVPDGVEIVVNELVLKEPKIIVYLSGDY
jgi:hypothetical protein